VLLTFIEFEKLGFLNICNRVKQLNHIYNIFNNKSPEYMHKIFKINTCISLYGTRSSNSNFYIPPIKGGESTTFFYSGIIDWNSLPDQIKSCDNKNSFKINVNKFLMEGLGSSFHSEFICY
jgi:hypothetical protein